MQRALKLIGGVAIIAVSFLGTLWLVGHYVWLACPAGERFALTKPFEKNKDLLRRPGALMRDLHRGYLRSLHS
jgi:hypothetical protein